MGDHQRTYAGLLVRMIAFGFDYLVVSLYIAIVIACSIAVNSAFPGIPNLLFSHPLVAQLSGFVIITLPVTLYFVVSEGSVSQATWGKRRQRLKVMDTNGKRMGWGRALGRTALKFVPWEISHACIWQFTLVSADSQLATVGLVVVWGLIGANMVSIWRSPMRQALYDRLAGTVVVFG